MECYERHGCLRHGGVVTSVTYICEDCFIELYSNASKPNPTEGE